jgi:hypothetical protein
MERCCSCSSRSTCQTVRCECKAIQATGLEDEEQKETKETEYTTIKESEAGSEDHLTGESLRPKTIGADLPGFVLTDTDKEMDKVCGYHIHHNDGTHLDGGFGVNVIWQKH